jgi:hypothetical protein
LKSPKTKRSREKPKPRRINRNLKRKNKVKEAFYRSDVVCNLLIKQIISTPGL